MVTCPCAHRVGGLHRFEATVSGERRYCIDCGERDVDWTLPFTLDRPVRLPTREELLQDARRGHWRPIVNAYELPNNRSIIVGVAPPSTPELWYMKRMVPGTNHIIWCVHTGLAATHWAEDLMGSPVR